MPAGMDARRAARAVRPGVVAGVADVVAVAGLLAVVIGPGRGAEAVQPALDHAIAQAAETGVPAAVWDLTGDGVPDPDAPLVAGLATLPPEVRVRIWPRPPGPASPDWGLADVLEVDVTGRPGVACVAVRASAPASSVVGWRLDPRGGWMPAVGRSVSEDGGCVPGGDGEPIPLPPADDVPTAGGGA